MHPDVNPSKDAITEFIDLNEAYEYLTDPKFRKITNIRKRKNNRTKTTKNHWSSKKKKKTNQKARKHAKMNVKSFTKKMKLDMMQKDITNTRINFSVAAFCFTLFFLIAYLFTEPEEKSLDATLFAIGFCLFFLFLVYSVIIYNTKQHYLNDKWE